MRVVVIVFAALMTLGLAAFGVVAAQRAAGPDSLIALAVHVIAPAQTNNAAPPSPPVAPAAARPASPVVSVVQTPSASETSNPAPARLAQNPTAATTPAPAAAAPTPAPTPPAAKAIPACNNPDAIGLSRVVEIDTTGGPAFGTEHFKQYDFLRDKEVVLTFDDGPWPENTPAVLKALQDNCIKATFFEIGQHDTWRPDISRQVAAAGMTVGNHTWSHKDLARNPYAKDIELAKEEIEMGVSAVHMAVG